jgi:hypothetical protein
MTSAMLLTMVLCFALTISVAVAIGLAAIVGIQVSNVNMLVAVKEMFSSINKFPLAAIPFFILAGNIMETGGISRRSGGVWQEHRRRRAGRPAHDLRADLHDLRSSLGLQRGHHLCHRGHPDSGAHQARLPHRLTRPPCRPPAPSWA